MDKNARGGIRRYVDTVKPQEYEPNIGEVDSSEISLTGLADLFGSDKGSIKHNYTAEYESVIRSVLAGRDRKSTALRICEIGVACGASLRMWSSYLPGSKIIGYDVREDCSSLCAGVENIEIRIFDPVANPIQESHIDLFIDDASHISEDIVSIFVNCWKTVRSGGYYAIEDLSCTYNEQYTLQFNKTFNKNAVNDRATFVQMVDELMRLVDSRKDVAEIRYTPQLLVMKKL
jgi:hypothetical protein